MSDAKKFKKWYKERCGHGLPVNLGMKAVIELDGEIAELREMLQHVMKCAAMQDNELIDAEEIKKLLNK